MTDRPLKFRHEVIDPDPPGSEHDITLIADVNGNGRNDIIIGGKVGPPNLFWYENPSWVRHDMAAAPGLEAGGVVLDLTGTGRPDVIAGQQYGGNELYWFENPDDPTGQWKRWLIEDRFAKYHDQAIGDVDNDGRPELLFLSQCAGVLAYYDLAHDPRVEPWPTAPWTSSWPRARATPAVWPCARRPTISRACWPATCFIRTALSWPTSPAAAAWTSSPVRWGCAGTRARG